MAVARAESAGGVNSWNTAGNSAGKDEGLWQINTYYNPRYATFDPLANARGAVAISNNGTNWHPWSTYNNGAYRAYMPGGASFTSTAASTTQNPGSANPAPGGGGGAQQAGWFGDLFGWLNGSRELSWAGGGAAGMLSTGIEQGLVHTFASIFKFLLDHLLKPLFWTAELVFGPVIILAGLAILVQNTKAGAMATSLLGVLPGPLGAVGKVATGLGTGSRMLTGGGGSAPKRGNAEYQRRSAASKERVTL